MTAEHKKTAALSLVEECATRLGTLREASAVRGMATTIAERAWALQGDPKDRPYFTRTLSQLAHALRVRGWVEIACGLLEWGMERGALDGHVLSEVVECHLARGDTSGAEAVLERAQAERLATDAIYTSLVKAYGRARRPDRARLLFDRARSEGAVTSFTYPALISAYAVVGDLASAQHVFESARMAGQLSAPAYTAIATALALSGDLARVDNLLDMARRSGHMTARLAYAAIRGRLNNRQFGAARQILHDARRDGAADAPCYQVIISACHRAGRHREAKRVLASALSDARLTPEDLKAVKAAHCRSRRAARPHANGATIAA